MLGKQWIHFLAIFWISGFVLASFMLLKTLLTRVSISPDLSKCQDCILKGRILLVIDDGFDL